MRKMHSEIRRFLDRVLRVFRPKSRPLPATRQFGIGPLKMIIKVSSVSQTPDRISSRLMREVAVPAGPFGLEAGLYLEFKVGAPFLDERILG